MLPDIATLSNQSNLAAVAHQYIYRNSSDVCTFENLFSLIFSHFYLFPCFYQLLRLNRARVRLKASFLGLWSATLNKASTLSNIIYLTNIHRHMSVTSK